MCFFRLSSWCSNCNEPMAVDWSSSVKEYYGIRFWSSSRLSVLNPVSMTSLVAHSLLHEDRNVQSPLVYPFCVTTVFRNVLYSAWRTWFFGPYLLGSFLLPLSRDIWCLGRYFNLMEGRYNNRSLVFDASPVSPLIIWLFPGLEISR